MHPAAAFEIKQHCTALISELDWAGCETVKLDQTTDGMLIGSSETTFAIDLDGDLTAEDTIGIASLIDVLCELSRCHQVDWCIEHDYEDEPIGCVREGIADVAVIEELSTICTIGEMLGDFDDDLDLSDQEWSEQIQADLRADDGEPKLLKFPGVE